ncbi:MAG: tetratricopeptide repeat protein [Anaerolineae bacterium]
MEEAQAIVEELMAHGGFPYVPPRTPLEQAQDIMYDAWGAKGSRRAKLAREALRISPDCADAYVLLAEETARTVQEAHDLFEQGVRAGERALGDSMFREKAGNFWAILETRPYMRARAGLAETSWVMGKRQEAIDHLRDLLRLNPGDNQGLRYNLIAWLLATGDDAAAEKLLNEYSEDKSAYWAYSRALLLFRKSGATSKAYRALDKALDANPYVPSYLFGLKRLPKRMPEFIEPGGESEAIEYLAMAWEAWGKTPGALEWLMSGCERKVAGSRGKHP